MTRKRVAKPTGKGRTGVAATVAAGLPLLLSFISTGGAPQPAPAEPPSHVVVSGKPVFKVGCQLPFDSIKSEGLEIDAKCTSDGTATADDLKDRLEFNAKNNFCAEGTPRAITYDDLKGLQVAADAIDGLRDNLTKSRKDLLGIFSPSGQPKLGEGTLVQLVAFVKDAHNSNVGAGEKVNCKLTKKEENDIHIELMPDQTEDDPCKSVTAEMSPHFRPEGWNDLVRLKLERPVRITGSLFFDNSHQPCRGDKRPNPKRISLWEIHPVYQFEICKVKPKSPTECDVKTDSQWIPLDQWHTEDSDVEP
ncbi:MAG: hypothetical protein JWM21_1163 [Acidobacteria bacterium]|nr:hypothetical protein [Acidobacteriota bacterium]